MRYLIIGSSAAGIGAVEGIRQIDKVNPITIISAENYPLYSRCLLSYYLSGKLTESGLHIRPDDWSKINKANMFLGKKVVLIETDKGYIQCSDGSKYYYDKLLIATGATVKIPPNIPSGMEGIFTLRTVEDAKKVDAAISPDGEAVILGGGLIGLKAAFALLARKMKTTVVLKSKSVLSQMIDFNAAQLVQKKMTDLGIDILTQSEVTEVITEGKNIIKVVVASKEGSDIRNCSLLIAAKGVHPNTELAEGTGIEKNGGILTDEHMRTNNENIYAAGDVAETYDIALEDRTVNALWTCAVQQGKIAGFNMAGTPKSYDGSAAMNSLNFPGLDIISFGNTKADENQGFEIYHYTNSHKNIYKKIVLKDNRIKGLILINAIDNAGLLLSLMGRKIDVGSFQLELLNDNFNYGRVLSYGGAKEKARFWHIGHKAGI